MPTTYTPEERMQRVRRAEEYWGLPPGEPIDPSRPRRRSYPVDLMPKRSGGGGGGGPARAEDIDTRAIEACWALYRCFTLRADGIVCRLRAIATGKQLFQRRITFGATNHACHFGTEFVRRAFVTTTEREHDHSQQAAEDPVREVGQQFIQRFFRLAEAFFHGPSEQRFHVRRGIEVVVTLERRRGQIQVAQHIT